MVLKVMERQLGQQLTGDPARRIICIDNVLLKVILMMIGILKT